ncbi:MAG: hypothetical protein JWP74_2141 [Marmoricola sp.]|nr:hypothetical protein [Marmoricola sp.]
MNVTRGCGVALVIGMLLVPTACGKDDVDAAKKSVAESIPRPSSPEVADSLVTAGKKVFGSKKKFTKSQAECVADVVQRSDLSNKALQQVATDPTAFNPTGKDADVIEKLADPIRACLTK